MKTHGVSGIERDHECAQQKTKQKKTVQISNFKYIQYLLGSKYQENVYIPH